MKTKIAILFILIINNACVKPDESHLYQIRSGNHRSATAPIPHAGNEICFEFTVNSTWLQDNNAVNKICGFSLGLVHENSARLGWMFDGDRLQAYAYTYVEGVRFFAPFAILQVGQSYYCQITKEGDEYHFRLNEFEYRCPAKGWLPGDILLPYIGGEGTFENDWFVELKIK
jgi:hypothetical protein